MNSKTRDLVMGKLYLKNKDYKMAEKSFLDYLNLNPEDYQALKMLAQVYENMNNHQRAFEFYERSYLVDTQRKGTLLDICRLLLIEGLGLDHVDRKKWLKLAVQAFPTNPIVTNLRDTLPALESNSAPNKINLESELMSKMDRLEERLASIEQLLERIAVTKAEEPKQVRQTKPEESKPLVSSQPVEQKTPVPRNPEGPKLSLFSKPEDSKPFSFSQPHNSQPNLFNKPEESKPLSFSKPEESIPPSFSKPVEPKPLLLTKEKEPKDPVPLFPSLSLATDKPKQAAESKPKDPVPLFPSLSLVNEKPNEATESKPIFKPLSGGFTFGTGPTGGNLFADGLKKFNLPTEGSWTTTPVKPFSFNADQTNDATETKKDQEGGGDDEGNETVDAPELPIENTCDMQPIEIKSGEEDEDVVFEHRCKLFRFRDKEYKERGLGNIKVLKHKTTNAGRLIMRRDLINLVCLNCWSCSNIERVRDTQVRFAGLDASDGEPVMTVFLAKFKTQELTDTFISHLNELFHDESE